MKKLLAILAISLGLGVLFDYFFYGHTLGIAFPIYVLLILVALFALAKTVNVLAIPLLFFAVMVSVRSSPFLTFLNLAASLYLVLLITHTLLLPHLRTYGLKNYLAALFILPIQYIKSFFNAFSELIAFRTGIKNHDKAPQIIRGILVTLPFLFLFIILFASADLIFQNGVRQLVDFPISFDTVMQIGIVLVFTAGFFGTFWHLFIKEQSEQTQEGSTANYQIKPLEASILLGSLNALFLVFIVIQLRYLFGGLHHLAIAGVTYAEYARQGFFELIAVAILALILIFATERYAHKFLSVALIAQVFVIMVSAFKRLSLYEAAYGFTTLRLYSHLCIIFLGIVFLLMLYKIFVDPRENTFMFFAFIARKNIERFGQTGKLDIIYLTNLSDDALGELKKVPQIPASRFEKRPTKDWQSWRFMSSPL